MQRSEQHSAKCKELERNENMCNANSNVTKGENAKNNCKIRSMSVFSEQIRALDEIRKNFNKEFATLLI